MSNVAIKGGATGTATYTIEAPTGNTDRTLVLPDEAGTVLTSGTDVANFPSGFANGITQADIWRLAATKGLATATLEDITANLERSDSATSGLIGSGMSESSGIFTFPETGIYLVSVTAVFRRANSGSQRIIVDTQVSTDSGSNYSNVSRAESGITSNSASTNNFGRVSSSALVDVTSASTFRVKFRSYSESPSVNLQGVSDENSTFFSFIRLGDT